MVCTTLLGGVLIKNRIYQICFWRLFERHQDKENSIGLKTWWGKGWFLATNNVFQIYFNAQIISTPTQNNIISKDTRPDWWTMVLRFLNGGSWVFRLWNNVTNILYSSNCIDAKLNYILFTKDTWLNWTTLVKKKPKYMMRGFQLLK